MTTHPQQASIDHLIELEQKRCTALATGDLLALRQILSRDLLHTHTRGNCDNYDSYLEYMHSTLELLNIERGELRIRVYADAAVMTGKQTNTARLRNGDPQIMRIESKAIQVWAKEDDGHWRLTMFQATSLGPPVPVTI